MFLLDSPSAATSVVGSSVITYTIHDITDHKYKTEDNHNTRYHGFVISHKKIWVK